MIDRRGFLGALAAIALSPLAARRAVVETTTWSPGYGIAGLVDDGTLHATVLGQSRLPYMTEEMWRRGIFISPMKVTPGGLFEARPPSEDLP